MSAATVAAKARDPDRIAPAAPAAVSYEDSPASEQATSPGTDASPGVSNDSSGHSSHGSRPQPGQSPFQTSSLPPEILGLFNRAGKHSRNPSLQNSEASITLPALGHASPLLFEDQHALKKDLTSCLFVF